MKTRKEILKINPELEELEKQGLVDISLIQKITDDETKEKMKLTDLEKEEKLQEYIYTKYTKTKQQQDEKWVSSYTTKLKAQGVENLELKVVGMITSFYQGSNLEETLSSVEEAQKPYFEKLVKVGIRTEWMENCIKEGTTAIEENREANYPVFPKID